MSGVSKNMRLQPSHVKCRSFFAPQRIAGAAFTTAILALTIFAMIKLRAVHHMLANERKELLIGLGAVAVGGLQGFFNLFVATSLQNTKNGLWHGFVNHILSHIPVAGLIAFGSKVHFNGLDFRKDCPRECRS